MCGQYYRKTLLTNRVGISYLLIARVLLGCNAVVIIVGMLFRIESDVATGETKQSKTSVGCQWNIPSGIKVLLKPPKAE